jgi:hypothetical protein
VAFTWGGLYTRFAKQVMATKRAANVIFGNYIDLVRRPRTVKDSLTIGADERREVESKLADQLADQLMKRLPKNEEEEQRLIDTGGELARCMSWDAVAERFVFPTIRRACARRRVLSVA